MNEVTINEAFANAHGMRLGATFKALLNGKKHELKVVGIALSPLLGGVLVLSALTWSLWPKPVLVDVAEVRRGPLTVTVDEEGKARIQDV